MLVRALFFAFIALALLGDLRIFLYFLNRVVFGDHEEETSPWQWLIYVMPPLLVALTALFWPLGNWIERILASSLAERVIPARIEDLAWSFFFAKLGATWLIVAASVGMYWIVDRIHVLTRRDTPLIGVRSAPSEVVALRKAHVPFESLRKLGAHNDLYDIDVTRHEVFIDDLPQSFDGFRIAFLTDTHVASFMRRGFYREIISRVHAFDPDLVLLGGDFVTWRKDIPLMADVLLTGLTAREGVYAVLGNHDIWAGADAVTEAMTGRGVKFVVNRNVALQRNGEHLRLLGIDEMYRGKPDVPAAFAGVEENEPCIAVSHHPDIIDQLDGRRLDLLVCGHTHGGQIRLPFFGAIVVPSRHEEEFASGFHRVRGVLMYVSRGIGAIPPLRILCRPEVATFTLRRGGRQ
ncbi:MAG: metallophosphoesterase [Thermoanaerobaculia bacterium]